LERCRQAADVARDVGAGCDRDRGCQTALSAISNGVASWTFRLIVRPRPSKPGFRHALTSASSCATVAVDTARRSPGLPEAKQVADRWHLMENASSAFLDAVRKSMRSIRQALGAGEVNPTLLTCAERLQYEGFLRREETNTAIRALPARRSSRGPDRRTVSHRACLAPNALRPHGLEIPAIEAEDSVRLGRVPLPWIANGSRRCGKLRLRLIAGG
jgi:hypothetical protein